jgi:signal transduction histidine kinase
LGRARLSLLAAAMLVAPFVLALQTARAADLHPYVLATVGGAISALVLVRLTSLFGVLDRFREQERRSRLEVEAAHVQLREQNEQLQELDRLKDELIGLISHDLRTPLTSILGYVELLEADLLGPLTDEQRSGLEIVSRSSQRLLKLVNDLLFVARLQVEGLTLRVERVNLAAIIRGTIDSLRPRADAKKIDLSIDTPAQASLDGDPDRLAQLLDNLVSNAIKFTPEAGSVRVHLTRDSTNLHLDVADTGIGIPAADQPHLFDRFYRSSNAIAQQIPGTGLGLHITQAIVTAHHGHIRVNSQEGHGTTFHIDLPAHQHQHSESTEAAR